MRCGYLVALATVALLLSAGCTADPAGHSPSNPAVGLWLKGSDEPDILLNVSSNGSAELRFLINLGIARTVQVRNGTWESTGDKSVNLTYRAPLTNGTRTMSLALGRDELRLVRVWNETAELSGDTNLSFRRVMGTPSNEFFVGLDNPLATAKPT
jgi:hypothetical protein